MLLQHRMPAARESQSAAVYVTNAELPDAICVDVPSPYHWSTTMRSDGEVQGHAAVRRPRRACELNPSTRLPGDELKEQSHDNSVSQAG
jgi:hypothetical protein